MLALALAASGCFSPPTRLDEESHKAPSLTSLPLPPAIVTPDEVTEANAAEKAQALARELDYAANDHPAPLPLATLKEGLTKP